MAQQIFVNLMSFTTYKKDWTTIENIKFNQAHVMLKKNNLYIESKINANKLMS